MTNKKQPEADLPTERFFTVVYKLTDVNTAKYLSNRDWVTYVYADSMAELRRLYAYCQELESQVILDCMTHDSKPLAAGQAVAPAVPTGATGGEWRQPTTAAQRMGDVLQLLCGGKRPPDDMVTGWLDELSEELRDFCATHGPVWAQGIALIDLAMVAVEQPTEGVSHEIAARPAPPAMDGPWKDHSTAQLVNELRDIAVQFHGTQQLRERIARVIVPLTDKLKAAMDGGDAGRLERERICAAIKVEDDYCVDRGNYMLDSDDCIKIVRGEWVRPDFAIDAARAAQKE